MLGLLAFAAAAAQPAAVTADPQVVAAAMMAAGYKAKPDVDKDGDPMIVSAASGSEFDVYFYGCTNHRACTDIQFASGYDEKGKGDPAVIADWNRSKRYGRAYLTKDGNSHVEMDVDLDKGGISAPNFEDQLSTFDRLKSEFEKAIKW